MARPEKVAVVEEVKEKLQRGQCVVLTDYRGLDVKEITELRRRLREVGVEFKVLKNTLTLIAAKECGLDELEPYLEGPTAVAFGYDDPVVGAKVISDFAKEHADLEVKGGVLNGRVIDVEAVKSLADLPSREQLIAQVLRGLQSPISGLANVLQGVPRNFVYVLEAIRKQKEDAA